MPIYPELFPITIKFIKDIIGEYYLGKAFVHRLKTKDRILRHCDLKITEISSLIKRYHIYLNIPVGMEIEFDGAVVDDPSKFRNTLVDFSLKNMHSYKNNSEENFIFIVFDQCKFYES